MCKGRWQKEVGDRGTGAVAGGEEAARSGAVRAGGAGCRGPGNGRMWLPQGWAEAGAVGARTRQVNAFPGLLA